MMADVGDVYDLYCVKELICVNDDNVDKVKKLVRLSINLYKSV